jgi:hypothetical protein
VLNERPNFSARAGITCVVQFEGDSHSVDCTDRWE